MAKRPVSSASRSRSTIIVLRFLVLTKVAFEIIRLLRTLEKRNDALHDYHDKVGLQKAGI